MPELIIQSRITPRKSLKNIVSRVRLLNKLDENIDKNLIVINCPAGYGKTTLVQDYLLSKNKPYAWFHLPEDITSFYTFFSHIVHAFKSVEPEFGKTTLEAIDSLKENLNLSSDVKTIVTTVTGTFINEFFDKFKNDVILVLDDLHHAEDNAWYKVCFETLMENFPENLHIIVTTRNIPAFNTSRLSAKRNMFTLGMKDLYFTTPEVSSLIDDIYSLKHSEKDAVKLEGELNGWVTGMHLILQAYGEKFSEVTLDEKSLPENIFSYFAEDIFMKLDEQTMEFLLNTAYLDSFSPAVTNSILKINNSKEIINDLVARNIFIEPVHSEGTNGSTLSYRYINLFRQFLIKKLHELKTGDEVKKVIKGIYSYYAENKDTVSSIGFALKAGDFDFAVKEIINSFNGLFEERRLDILSAWMNQIPDNMTEANPYLLYFKGSLIRFTKSDSEKTYEYSVKALEKIDIKSNQQLFIDCILLKTDTAILLGKTEEAVNDLNSIIDLDTEPSNKANILFQLARTYYRIGPEYYEEMVTLLNKGIEICTEYSLKNILTNFYNLYGLITQHKGDFIKALYYFELVIKQETNFYKKFQAITNALLLHAYSGSYQKGFDLLEEARNIYSKFPSTFLSRILLRTEANFWFECGDYEQSINKYEQVAELELKSNIKHHICWYYRITSEAFYLLNKFDSAARYLELSLEYIDNNNFYQKLEYEFLKALLKKKTSVDSKIEKTLLTAQKYYESNKLIYGKAQIDFQLADYYFKTGLTETSLKNLRDCLSTSTDKKYFSYLEQNFMDFRYIFDFALSNNFQKDYIHSVQESLMNKSELKWLSAEAKRRLKKTTANMYDIFLVTFGGIEINVRGDEIPEERWIRKKSKLILVYLMLNPNTKFTKDKMLDLFFKDLSPESAENVFHQSITNIRNATKVEFNFIPSEEPQKKSKKKTDPKDTTGPKTKEKTDISPSYIIYEDKILRLNPNYYYKVDATEFNSLYHKIKSPEIPGNLKIELCEKAIELYKGEFLSGIYEDWCEDLRANYQHKFTDICEILIELLAGEKQYDRVIDYSEKLLGADKLHENAYLHIIESYVKLENMNMARSGLSRLLKAYEEEYGEKPPKSVLEKAQKLLLED